MSIILSATTNTPFARRHPAVFSDGEYIHYIGNQPYGTQTLSGFGYRSLDGITWEVTVSAFYEHPPYAYALVYSKGIYYNSTYYLLISDFFSEYNTSAYSSSNAIDYTYLGQLPRGVYQSRNCNMQSVPQMCVHNNRIYLASTAGYGSANGVSTVLSTNDFINYTIHQDDDAINTFSKRYGAFFYSKNGSLYIVGGVGNPSGSALTDMWRSDDNGYTWSLINASVSNIGNSSSDFRNNRFFIGSDLFSTPQFLVAGENATLQYTLDGENFLQESIFYQGSGNNPYGVSFVYHNGKVHSIGGSYDFIGAAYSYNYISVSAVFPSTDRMSFVVTPYHSPSPAYIRLTDTSNISASTDEYTRIWSIINNRTSEEILFSTSAAEFEIALNGIAGDTFNVSLSAVF